MWWNEHFNFSEIWISWQFFFYHIGMGSTKVETFESVAKYVTKLKMNAGEMINVGVTFINAKCRMLIHFSSISLVSVYSAFDSENSIPAII